MSLRVGFLVLEAMLLLQRSGRGRQGSDAGEDLGQQLLAGWQPQGDAAGEPGDRAGLRSNWARRPAARARPAWSNPVSDWSMTDRAPQSSAAQVQTVLDGQVADGQVTQPAGRRFPHRLDARMWPQLGCG